MQLYHFNTNYIRDLFYNLHQLVYPVTLRKLWCWFTYTMIGLLLWGRIFDMNSGWKEFTTFIKWHNVEFALFILLIDAFTILLSMIFTRYEQPVNSLESRINDNLAIIIPTHNSAKTIEKTVRACLKHVNPHQIFICDNNDSENPPDNTWERVRSIDPTINYHYNDVPNKSRAQYMGIMSKKNSYKYTMLIDDDVILPDNFDASLGRLEVDDNLQCLVYPLCGISGREKNSLFVEWQDLEYKLSGLVKKFQSNVASVLGPHGGISVWKTPVLKRIIAEGDTIFYGDDTKMGLYLLNRGFRSEMVNGVCVPTIVPNTLMGEMPNLYNQRVCSWDSTEHMLTAKFVEVFLRSYVRGSIARSLALRFFEAKILFDIFNDWVKLVVLAYFIKEDRFWSWLGLSVLANQVVLMVWNYGKCYYRSDIRCSLRCVATFWFYKIITSIFRILSLVRCYLFLLPNLKPPKPIFLEDDTQLDNKTPWRWSERMPIPFSSEDDSPISGGSLNGGSLNGGSNVGSGSDRESNIDNDRAIESDGSRTSAL